MGTRLNFALIDMFGYKMLMLGMANVLVLSAMLGIQGAGYLGISLAFLALGLSIHSAWLSGAVAKYVRRRKVRNQYKSSESFLKGALLYAVATGAIWCALLLCFGSFLGRILVRDNHIGICIMAIAPILLLYAVSEAISGYLKGLGVFRPVKIFLLVRQVAIFAGSIVGMRLLGGYGEKVAKLLHNDAVTCVYGAFGALLGVLAGCAAGLIVLLVFFLLLLGELRRMKEKDISRYQETAFHAFQTVFLTGIFQGLKKGVFLSPLLLNYILYVRICKKDVDSAAWIKTGGFLFGETLPVMALFILGFSILNYKNHRQLTFHLKSEAYGELRERISAMLLGAFALALPVCTACAVLSEPLLRLLTKEAASDGAKWLFWGCIAAFCVIFESIMVKLLQLWNETLYSMLALLVSFGAQSVFAAALFGSTDVGASGILYGVILQTLLFTAFAFVKLWRRMRLTGYFVKKLIMCGIVALSGTLIILLIYQFAGQNLPPAVALPVCVIPGFLLYLAALGLLGLIDGGEAAFMPGGALFLQINRILHRE